MISFKLNGPGGTEANVVGEKGGPVDIIVAVDGVCAVDHWDS